MTYKPTVFHSARAPIGTHIREGDLWTHVNSGMICTYSPTVGWVPSDFEVIWTSGVEMDAPPTRRSVPYRFGTIWVHNNAVRVLSDTGRWVPDRRPRMITASTPLDPNLLPGDFSPSDPYGGCVDYLGNWVLDLVPLDFYRYRQDQILTSGGIALHGVDL